MEKLEEIYSSHPNLTAVAGGLIVATAGIVLFRRLRRRKSRSTGDYPSNTVILHQIGRGPYAPSATPFAVKLETYLRIAKIPYQNEHSMETSSKGKFPWMTFNGEDVADSAFCIQFLNKHYNIDLSSWLTREQRAVAVAFQRMMEEDLYWVLVVTRWANEVDIDFMKKLLKIPMASLLLRFRITPAIRKMAWTQGIGRHSKDEVLQIARKDLTALNDYLGNKKFLMGDQPCEEDCAIFGQLSQIYWQMPSPLATIFKADFPKLVAYCERMKDTFWPDWVECTTQGGTVEATK